MRAHGFCQVQSTAPMCKVAILCNCVLALAPCLLHYVDHCSSTLAPLHDHADQMRPMCQSSDPIIQAFLWPVPALLLDEFKASYLDQMVLDNAGSALFAGMPSQFCS